MKQIADITAHTSHVAGVLFSPDAKRLLSCGMDALIKVWSVEDWSPAGEFTGHEKSVNCLAFSPDGKTLVIRLHGYTGAVVELSGRCIQGRA